MTAIILGSFTTNAIFMKCRLDQRFLNYVALRFGGSPELFFLMLLLGCMYCSALTIITLVALAAVRPLCEKESTNRKALVIGIGVSCTLGSVLTPISGTASLITLSVLSEFGHRVYFLYWMLVAIPVCTVVCAMTAAILLRLYGTPVCWISPRRICKHCGEESIGRWERLPSSSLGAWQDRGSNPLSATRGILASL